MASTRTTDSESPILNENTGDNSSRSTIDSPEGAKELQKFVSALLTLNHDLNNPLAGIVGYLELAMTGKEEIPQGALDMLKNVQKSADLMSEVINKLTEAKRELQRSVDISPLDDDH